MIARIWRGWTTAADADAYAQYVFETGMTAYVSTAGSRGAYLLQRDDGDRTEFLTISLWDDIESIRAFAGDDIEAAVFYPEDDRYLIDRDTVVRHYSATEASP